ncbi:MAG: hypothetical protein U9R48_00855 [Chloroflexota bacterium]|nr:hypothetical protein [Chloroflexota bacterium]
MMGGWGSSRWGWYRKKTTVEQCRWLDVNRWMREGIIGADHWRKGAWEWRDVRTGERTSRIGYEVRTQGASGWVRLYYTLTSGPHDGEEIDYRVPLTTTRPHFGGQRWWFSCPGRGCGGRRVGKLYLPPGEIYFLCRHCHDLTYRSAQEHDKTMDRYRRMSSEELLALIDDEGAQDVRAAMEILERMERPHGWF